MISVSFSETRGWRVVADYTAIGGTIIDICGAVNEFVARETARQMNEAKR